MSQTKPKESAVTLHVCKLCGKVGLRLVPGPVEFGGCAPPNRAHLFEALEVVTKPKA